MVTVNPVAKLDHYPVPNVEDLLAILHGGKVFTKLDLSHAYYQLLMDDESKKYVVVKQPEDCIGTHHCHMEYTQLLVFSQKKWIICTREFQELWST